MPTITFADGSSLTWGEAPPVAMGAVVAPEPAPPEPTSPIPEEPAAISPDDVKAALNAVPPKWSATLRRFAKVLGAAVVATVAAYQGNFAALLHDPTAAIALAGTALLAAGEKFVRWKE